MTSLATGNFAAGTTRSGNPAPRVSVPDRRLGAHRRLADPTRFHNRRVARPLMVSALIGVALTIGLIAVPTQSPGSAALLLLGGAWVSLMLAMTLPTRSERAGEELTARLGRFRHAVNAIGDSPTRAQLEAVLKMANDLDLHDDEIADDVGRVHASIAALELLEQIESGRLPIVAAPAALSSGDTCHFVAPVRCGRRRADQYGELLLTTGWLRFAGRVDASVGWNQIADIQRAGKTLVVTVEGRRGAFRFSFQSIEEAARCGVIAGPLRSAVTVPEDTTACSLMM